MKHQANQRRKRANEGIFQLYRHERRTKVSYLFFGWCICLSFLPAPPSLRANSRVRNREHARNTRIRKKQYVESLKLQVGEMLQAKAREERDARLESSKITAEVSSAGRGRSEEGGGGAGRGGRRYQARLDYLIFFRA